MSQYWTTFADAALLVMKRDTANAYFSARNQLALVIDEGNVNVLERLISYGHTCHHHFQP